MSGHDLEWTTRDEWSTERAAAMARARLLGRILLLLAFLVIGGALGALTVALTAGSPDRVAWRVIAALAVVLAVYLAAFRDRQGAR